MGSGAMNAHTWAEVAGSWVFLAQPVDGEPGHRRQRPVVRQWAVRWRPSSIQNLGGSSSDQADVLIGPHSRIDHVACSLCYGQRQVTQRLRYAVCVGL